MDGRPNKMKARRSAMSTDISTRKGSVSGDHGQVDGNFTHLGTDQVSFMQSALVDFDGLRVDAALRAGFDPSRTFIDSAKYRNALHELVLNYTSYTPIDRPPKLHIKFIDILTTLLHAGLDVNEGDCRRQTPLHLVCSSSYGQHPEIINALIGAGARVNQPDYGQQTPLHLAVQHGSHEDVDALLRGGADPNFCDNMGHSCLHIAAKRRNNVEMLRLLVKRGANVNLNHPEWTKHSRGATPLHTAARQGQVINASVLLELGANPNYVDASGQTALHVAATHEITGMLCLKLITGGARVDAADSLFGETALHKAVKSNAIDNVIALIKVKANVNIADTATGDTALHKAASLPNVDRSIWNALLAAKVKVDTPNFDELTAMDKAQRAKNTLGVALLRAYEPW